MEKNFFENINLGNRMSVPATDIAQTEPATGNNLGRTLIILSALSFLYSLYSQYFYLSLLAGVALITIIKLLWRPYLPPILLYFFLFHWVQIFGVIFYADYCNLKFENLFSSENLPANTHPQTIITITLLQLMLMCTVVGVIFSFNRANIKYETIKEQVNKLDVRKILIAFIICTIAFPTLGILTRNIASISQLVIAASIIRSVLLITLIFILLLRKTPYNAIIVGLLVLEFVLGFVSYFSSFKEVILYILIAFVTVRPKVKPGSILLSVALVVFLGYVMIFWSYVKPEYRVFINGNNTTQEVTVSRGQALNFLEDKAKDFSSEQFNDGVVTFLNRIQYMGYYMSVQERVPLITPHENGEITGGAFQFLFLPRFIEENKGTLDPSAMVAKYTGVQFKGADEGTSISMGYFADFYIDYGFWGMCIPLVLIAMILGFSNNYLLNVKKYNVIFTYSICIALVIGLGTFESDIIFFLGSIRNAIVLFLLANWLVFPRLNTYIEDEGAK